MNMFIELHLLQLGPANWSCHDIGSPKDAIFGGHRRARISSKPSKPPFAANGRRLNWYQFLRKENQVDGNSYRKKAIRLLGKEQQLLRQLLWHLPERMSQRRKTHGNRFR